MAVFEMYSRYYDLLYDDKNYQAETDYVDSLIKEYNPNTKTILELGCGTGKHAQLLSLKGYRIVGVDQSDEMLNVAKSRKYSKEVSFFPGDIRNFRCGKTVETVISLFHVISYQTSNEDIDSAFQTAANHLKAGGIFIFDVWYQPAVLTDKPSVRIKRLENDDIKVTRLAEPVMHPIQNIVDVNYEIIIEDKKNCNAKHLHEKHRMRYYSSPEIEYYLSKNGFSLLHQEEWLTGNEPGFDSWGVCFVAMLK